MRKKGELDQIGQNGYDFAKKHFDRNKLAQEYIQNIESLISLKNNPI